MWLLTDGVYWGAGAVSCGRFGVVAERLGGMAQWVPFTIHNEIACMIVIL